jgi:membrane protein DedA with SNARE-associated domain/rhodanese-related sulfurtransferase
MSIPEHFLLLYGYALVFGAVLLCQLGVPLPVTPLILTAGALSAEHELSFGLALLAGLGAALVADSAWFFAGKHYGRYVMRLLCKMSLEPTTCVRKTETSYKRHHGVTLLIAKFVPGLSMLAPPVAGQKGMSYQSFLLFDGAGAILWLGALLAGGRTFGVALEQNPHLLDWVGKFSGALLLVGIAGFLIGRVVRRKMILNKIIKARLEPHELKSWLDAGDDLFIVDLRHPLEVRDEPYSLPGARHISLDTLMERHAEIPRDRDVIVYCDCRPTDATAVATATKLQKLGLDRVRPLRGGYTEWKRLGFPLAPVNDSFYPAE